MFARNIERINLIKKLLDRVLEEGICTPAEQSSQQKVAEAPSKLFYQVPSAYGVNKEKAKSLVNQAEKVGFCTVDVLERETGMSDNVIFRVIHSHPSANGVKFVGQRLLVNREMMIGLLKKTKSGKRKLATAFGT